MAGHSKWANIKHRKGRQDAKRGKPVRQADPGDRGGRTERGGDIASNRRWPPRCKRRGTTLFRRTTSSEQSPVAQVASRASPTSRSGTRDMPRWRGGVRAGPHGQPQQGGARRFGRPSLGTTAALESPARSATCSNNAATCWRPGTKTQSSWPLSRGVQTT